jgi:YVTN family beta-propeller protein
MKRFFSAIVVLTFVLALEPFAADLIAGVSSGIYVNIDDRRIVKLNPADGTILWSVNLNNDGALAVDPIDLGVYTGLGGQSNGEGTVYKLNANGTSAWTNSISVNGESHDVTNVAVDSTSADPGVIWSVSGGLVKSNRETGAQEWSISTNDIDRPSIHPGTGQIYAISTASNTTLCSFSADGATLNSASSADGYTDLNPADRMLYLGRTQWRPTLSQINTSSLRETNWTMDLSAYISSIDALAVQPWQGGYIYVASVDSSKIAVVDPTTRTVVASFGTAVPPKYIAVNPVGGEVYSADDRHPFVAAYSPTGAVIWMNPDLGGAVSNIATPRGVVGGLTIDAAASSTCPTITLSPTNLTTAFQGLPYNQTITATGGSGPYLFGVFSGSLPPGLTLGSDGTLAGTPTSVGSFQFSVIATDFSTGCSGGQTYTIQVEPLSTCPVPTVRISSDRNSIHKGETATITLNFGANSSPPCGAVTVFFALKTHAQQGVDYILTDQFGQVVTNGQIPNGPLLLHNLFTSRTKTLLVNFVLQKNKAYYLGNKQVSVQLLAQ